MEFHTQSKFTKLISDVLSLTLRSRSNRALEEVQVWADAHPESICVESICVEQSGGWRSVSTRLWFTLKKYLLASGIFHKDLGKRNLWMWQELWQEL